MGNTKKNVTEEISEAIARLGEAVDKEKDTNFWIGHALIHLARATQELTNS